MLIGTILVFLAFVAIGIHLSRRDTEVKMHDQVIQEKGKTLKTSKVRYFLIGFAVGVGLGIILTGNLIITLIFGGAGAYLVGQKLYNSKEEKRQMLLNEQFTQVLNSIISSLEAGSNPYQALEEAVPALKNPARDIFIEILRQNRTGTNYHEAIAKVAEQSGWEDLRQIEVAFRLYNSAGGDLVAVFNYLLQAAYENKADRKYIDGITSQIRMTALVLSAMPFFLMGAMRYMSPEFAYPLFNEPVGVFIVILIIILVAIGNKIVNKMVENIY